MPASVPTFYLYGEPHRHVAADFIHVETLDDRSRPSEWTIRPHAHAELNHIFLISDGGGAMSADAWTIRFNAPVLLVVPARTVHGFEWSRESSGRVATIARAELAAIALGDAEIGSLFARARAIPLDDARAARAGSLMHDLARELGWSQPGRHAALRGAALGLMVLALRGLADEQRPRAAPGRQAALVARFRERTEQRFRHREPVSAHATHLGVSESALRAACTATAGCSPAALIDERVMLEARRALLYSDLTVAEIGWSLGFADPAYFSRFFARHAGQSARAFRRRAGQASDTNDDPTNG